MSTQSSVYKEDGVICFGNWVQKAQLGTGGFGTVALWKHRLTDEQLAIKIFKDVKNKERSLQEIELTKRLSHKNVVKLLPIPDDWKKLSSSILCMEYCTEGNLRELLNKPENCSGLSENVVRRCLKNVKDGLEYIHGQNIVHRDLKPENVVLQKVNDDKMENPGKSSAAIGQNGCSMLFQKTEILEKGENLSCPLLVFGRRQKSALQVVFKLIDFGYGVDCDRNNSEKLRTLAGTSDYVAPEVFIASDGYTISVDYWGFGFICFEIITGRRPFLPHLKAVEWIAKIRYKTEEVICVYEIPYKTNSDSIAFSSDIPPENHISKALANDLVLWLRLALKMDYRKRGRNKHNELIIFSFMEEILSKKVISIFSSVDCALLSYHVDDSTTSLEIKQNISRDTGHTIDDQIVLSPSGAIVADDAKLTDFWNPSSEGAMLFVVSKEGVTLPFKELNPPQSIVTMAEQWKEPSAYHCRKKVYSDSIYFIQTQLNLCKAFYKTIDVELLSVSKLLQNLVALDESMRHNLLQCSAKLHLVQLSIQYNEKCYARACESKVIVECEDFLREKKEKILSLKSGMEQTEKKLKVFIEQLQNVKKKLSETQAVDCFHNIEKLNKHLEHACSIYKNLQKLPKELRESEGNCSDMVKIMYDFLDSMHTIIDDKICQETVEKSKSCKVTIKSMFPVVRGLSRELRNLDDDVVRVELGLFKAVWGLKKPHPVDDSVQGKLSASSRNVGSTVLPTSRMSVSSAGAVSSTSHDEDETTQSAAGLISVNRSLHRQFEECLAQFKGNFEEVMKCYNIHDPELQTVINPS